MSDPSKRHDRLVLHDEEWGVYLGSFWGLGFWSKIDPVGQSGCCDFESVEEMVRHMATWPAGSIPAGFRFTRVRTADPYVATIAECTAAGLPAWTPGPDAPDEAVGVPLGEPDDGRIIEDYRAAMTDAGPPPAIPEAN